MRMRGEVGLHAEFCGGGGRNGAATPVSGVLPNSLGETCRVLIASRKGSMNGASWASRGPFWAELCALTIISWSPSLAGNQR